MLLVLRLQGRYKGARILFFKRIKYLEDLINNVEFIDVYPWLGVLEQFDDENLLKSTISI